MTTYTIGYSVNVTQPSSQTHIAPHLFYQAPDLAHLNWVSTIYPKHDNHDLNIVTSSEQLANYVKYYISSHKLIIGGDQTALIGVCQAYEMPTTLCILSNTLNDIPHSTATRSLLDYLNSNLPTNSQVLLSPDLEELNQCDILAIDARCLHEESSLSILSSIESIKEQPNTLIITNYDPQQDPQQITYQHLTKLISRLSS